MEITNDAQLETSMSPSEYCAMQRRRQAWPLLTQCTHSPQEALTVKERRRLWEMVSLDVNRTHYLLRDIPEGMRQYVRDIVLDIIMDVLSVHSDLNYFQGYHEVVTIVYLLLRDTGIAREVVHNLTVTYFRDFMDSDFGGTIHAINLVGLLLRSVDRPLYTALQNAQVTFDFALASLLTWFAHSASLDWLASIFDYTISSNSAKTPIYMVVASLSQRRDEIIPLCSDSDQFSSLFTAISQLPLQGSVNSLLTEADKLIRAYPDIDNLVEEAAHGRGYYLLYFTSVIVLGASALIYYHY